MRAHAVWKSPNTWPPSTVTIEMTNVAMRATTMAYSTALAPRSLRPLWTYAVRYT